MIIKMKGVMKMKQSKMFIPVIVFLVCISDIYAQDWPQYLGPNRNGVSAQKGITLLASARAGSSMDC
jgi:N-acetylneuraminic acid mutarotase